MTQNSGARGGETKYGQPHEAPKVAIVGMAALFPGQSGTTGFWRTIARGKDAIAEVPPNYWRIEDYYDPDPAAPDKTYCKRGGFLEQVAFDTLRFGVPPSAMTATDTAQLLALLTASEVLDGVAKSQRTPIDKQRTGVVLGVASATELCVHMGSRLQRPVWASALREAGLPEEQVNALCDRISERFVPWQEASFPGLLGNVVAGRIANRLDLGGANFVTDAACASSLSALQVALSQLYLREADLVVTGGVDALNDILMFMCFSKTPAFSRSGDCRPFSDNADGTILGEGVSMFALRRLEDAERDGNDIYAVIRGLGAASDGRATSVYAPRPEGQALALERAYAAAGYSPATVELLEAHGTGTKAGDAAEFAGLSRVFAPANPERRQWCALGSVKSQIGHTKAAAGGAGLFKAAMALHHGVLPPTLKVERPNPKLKVDESPFCLNTELRPWVRGANHPRRASVSSFGFGGSNFHVTLEEYRGPAKRAPKRRHHDSELVLLSADDAAGLDKALAAAVERAASVDLSLVAFESQSRFDPSKRCRVSLPVNSRQQLADMAAKAREMLAQKVDKGAIAGGGRLETTVASPGRVAILFPGQGSQYVGMGSGLATAFDAARRVWDRAADLISFEGAPLHDVVFPAPAFTPDARAEQEARLTQMAATQPAIAVTEAATLAVLDQLGVRAASFAGHSFGEVMALYAAGSYGLDTALQVAAERGRLMTETASNTEGAMLAVSADYATVQRVLAELKLELVIANDNGPQQVVVSGGKDAILAAQAALKQRGLAGKLLPVATAFHSKIVAGSCQPFRHFLEGQALVAPGRIVYANATATPYPTDACGTEEMLSSQLGQPVRFRETIERMYADGVRTFIEVGPGNVLTKLVGQCLGDRPHRMIALDRKGVKGLSAFWQGLGELALAGVNLNFGALWDEAPAEPEAKRPAGPQVFEIGGSNVGKPYPAMAGKIAPARPAPPAAASVAAVGKPVAHDAASEDVLARFQHKLDEQQKRLEASLLDAHRAYMETSKAAFLAAVGGKPTEAEPRITVEVPATPVATPAPAPAPVVVPMAKVEPPVPASDGVMRLIEQIVADKTGYPVEVLGADMDLEAELGIDSIKQVEILSALREKLPDMPELEPAALAKYRTIGSIAGLVAGQATVSPVVTPVVKPEPAQVAAPIVAKIEPVVAEPVAVGPADDGIVRLVEQVVAEKTGYPVEVLGPDMDLEAELGIDSIKQVEILSALREKLPHMPELEPAALAKYRTIGAIAGLLAGQATTTPAAASMVKPEPVSAAAPAVVQVAPAAPAPVHDNVMRLIEQIVADKTGYPVEVLGADMDLEAELGIDSIKQVEILSALREKLPDMPELEPAALAKYRTIGAIAGLVGEQTNRDVASPADEHAPAVAATNPFPVSSVSSRRQRARA